MLLDEDKLAIKNLFDGVKRFRRIDYFSKPFVQVLLKDSERYTQITEKPMDFETLQNNFYNNKYLTLKEFKDDLNLIWFNLYKYQGCDNELGKAAKRIERYCNDYLSKLCKNTEAEKENCINLGKKRKRETQKDRPKTTNNNNKNSQNKTQVKQSQKKGKNKKRKNTNKRKRKPTTSKTQQPKNNSCPDDGNKIDKISTTDDSEFSCSNVNQDKNSYSIPNYVLSNDIHEDINEQNNSDLKNDFTSENNKSPNQKIITNNNYSENITLQEKEQFLVLITKLTVPNQVKLICKIEEYEPDIIKVFSGNIDISFNIMTKNIYTQIMQYGQSLLEAQTETDI